MKERYLEFNEQEKSEIAEVARALARLGEEAVWEVSRARVQLMGVAIKAINGIQVDGVYYSHSQIEHEVEVMNEVISQARLILQFEGRDTLSDLDRRAQEAGWGSVYDPDSKIYKVINTDSRGLTT